MALSQNINQQALSLLPTHCCRCCVITGEARERLALSVRAICTGEGYRRWSGRLGRRLMSLVDRAEPSAALLAYNWPVICSAARLQFVSVWSSFRRVNLECFRKFPHASSAGKQIFSNLNNRVCVLRGGESYRLTSRAGKLNDQSERERKFSSDSPSKPLG